MNTNGSATLSQSEVARITQILIKFAESKLSISQIEVGLQDYLSINFDAVSGSREIKVTNLVDLTELVQIPIEAEHLRYSLQKYIAGDSTESELSDWAAFIFLSDLFVQKEESEEDHDQDQVGGGAVWDILQRLMTPEVFDGLDHKVARKYIDEVADAAY